MRQRKFLTYILSLLFVTLLSTNVFGNESVEINGDGNFNGDNNIDGDRNIKCGDNSVCTLNPDEINDDISGVWEQYLLDKYGRWIYVGEFEVAKRNGGGLMMVAKEQIAYPGLFNSLSIFDITYNEKLWTFKSNLGHGLISKFKLQKVSDNVFKGYSLINGQLSASPSRWLKIN